MTEDAAQARNAARKRAPQHSTKTNGRGRPRGLGLGRAPAVLAPTRFASRLLAPSKSLGRIAPRGVPSRDASTTSRAVVVASRFARGILANK
eukprot:15452190-Alexandrium_andersonii.AAC.1